jgi:hypothetical protein
MSKAKVISGDGTTVSSSIVNHGKEYRLSQVIIQVPEAVYETEESVAISPAKSVWLNADAAKQLYEFLKESFEEAEQKNNDDDKPKRSYTLGF